MLSAGNEEGENEVLVGKAIAGNRDKWFVASKCGIYYGEDGQFGFNANPDKVGYLSKTRALSLVHLKPFIQFVWCSMAPRDPRLQDTDAATLQRLAT